MQNKTKSKIFYGWYVVAAECVLAAMIMGIIYNCYGLFVVPVCEELNFPRQAMAMTQTILSLCGLGLSLLAGKLFTRRYTMKLVRFGAIITPVMYGCYAFISQEWMLYAIALVVGIGYALTTTLSIPVIISNWFEEKRGFALGIALMGSGIGGMLFNVVTGGLLNAFGWRATYLILAVLMLAVSVPLVFFVIRFCPEDLGMRPYGYKGDAVPEDGERPVLEGTMFRDALRMPRFWGGCVMLMLMGFCSCQLSQTMSPRMLDTGYGTTLTSMVISISMAVLAVGKVLEGKMFDSKLGAKGTSVFAAVMAFLHAVGLLFAQNQLMIPLLIAGFGLGCAYGSIGPSNVTLAQFGRRDYATIFGVVNALTSLGSMMGPIFSAAVFDRTGSYDLAYYVIMVCCVLHAVLAITAIRPLKSAKKA